jgi:excisionase family DNA binding protein
MCAVAAMSEEATAEREALVNELHREALREVLTVEEAAGPLGLSRQSVYASIRAKQLPARRVGWSLLISRAALDEFRELRERCAALRRDARRGAIWRRQESREA